MLKGKKILVGVTGSIAAYKIPILVRLLKKEHAEVKVLMTPSATSFITPLTLSVLSENPVTTEFSDKTDGSWHSHVQFGQWADIYLIAPTTATSIAKMCHAQADNIVIASYLAAKCPVFVAPAMDLDMYKHPANQKNIKQLTSFGNIIINSREGELASGLCGEGRMEEPEEILRIIIDYFKKKLQFKGKTVLVTAGPTYEKIDPVRFIGNFSTGKMGFALAEAFAIQGAIVKLISGPTHLKTEHPNIERFDVVSANEMYQLATTIFPKTDIAILNAAVADYSPSIQYDQKLKKKTDELAINLKPTKDILAKLGELKQAHQLLIGFALETENEIENARAKLTRKNLDAIVLNSLNDFNAGFGHDTNKITIIDRDNNLTNFELKTKEQVALDILVKIKSLLIEDKS